ncbi:MAG: hypothetical protein ACREHD_24480 [Pirellulales bacterium]
MTFGLRTIHVIYARFIGGESVLSQALSSHLPILTVRTIVDVHESYDHSVAPRHIVLAGDAFIRVMVYRACARCLLDRTLDKAVVSIWLAAMHALRLLVCFDVQSPLTPPTIPRKMPASANSPNAEVFVTTAIATSDIPRTTQVNTGAAQRLMGDKIIGRLLLSKTIRTM